MANKNSDWLFTFGERGDLYVKTLKYRFKSFCTQKSYDYHGKENALTGKSSEFTVKRVQVWQMTEDENEKHYREEKGSKILKEEVKKLNEATPAIRITREEEIKQLELLTEKVKLLSKQL